MMLWYKAWRESRARFLISASVVAGLSVLVVIFQQSLRAEFHTPLSVDTYVGYIYRFTYGGVTRGLFSLLVPVLGLGGLQRERAQHTDAFTLALPVSRAALIATRAAVGSLEIAVLSLMPALVICSGSPAVGAAYPWSQALQFSVLWTVVGTTSFAMWLLASVIFSSEYTAFTVCLIAGFFATPVLQRPALRSLHLSGNYIMSGFAMPYFDPGSDVLIGPFPWRILIVPLLIGLSCVGLSAVLTRRQDFA